MSLFEVLNSKVLKLSRVGKYERRAAKPKLEKMPIVEMLFRKREFPSSAPSPPKRCPVVRKASLL